MPTSTRSNNPRIDQQRTAPTENTTHPRSSALTFLLGGAEGASAALLFAPKTGADMRHRIARGAKDLRNSGQNFAHDMEDKAGAVGGALKSAVTEAKDTYKMELDKSHDGSPSDSKESAGAKPSENKITAGSRA